MVARAALVALAAGLLAGCGRHAPPSRPLRLAVAYELATLDPHVENTSSSYSIISNVYEPLVALDPELRVTPALAERWESPDALTWIFHLRAGVRFHSGRPLRAADVVFSIERLLLDRTLNMRSYVRDVVEVGARDERTVVVRTGRPSRILLNKLRSVLIVPEGSTAETLALRSDGTGPYRLTGWAPGKEVRLQANPEYWGGPPPLAAASYRLGCTPETAVAGLLAGDYDFAQADSPKVEDALRASPRHVLLRHENIHLKYLGYDLARDVTPFCRALPNPFKNPRVRRALHLALDRQRLVDALGGRGIPATQPVPRFVFGFDPDVAAPFHDLAQARALLREAGLARGFEVTLHARRILGETARLVRDQLAAVGVRVEVRDVGDAEYLAAVARHDLSFWLSRWVCATGDASEMLEAYVHSTDSVRQLGQNNYGGYSNPELDLAIEASAAIEAPHERRPAVQRIMRTLMDEMVLVPLYYDEDVYGLDRSLSWRPRYDSYVRAAEFATR